MTRRRQGARARLREGRRPAEPASKDARRDAASALWWVAAVLACAQTATAQAPVLFEARGAGSAPVTSPQFERYGWGGSLSVGARVPLLPWLTSSIRLRGLALSDGPAPSDPSLADPGVGGAFDLGLGLRLRIEGLLHPERVRRADGGWVELTGGAAVTGDLVRPMFGASLGWAFAIDDIDIGPFASVDHIVHFDDPLDDGQGFIISVGVELVLLEDREAELEVEVDTDLDGLLDSVDECPLIPEDIDGDRDEDGCPEEDGDRDGDGIIDRLDACPDQPEDLDEYRDEDGCPDLDDDSDGILDVNDECRLDPEVINGVEDEDGCPDVGLIAMVEGRIILDERVLFELNRSRIRHAARPTLAAIVELWRQHPEWARVRIDGHADERGTDEFNQELSTRRAERVREALIELGMTAEMLTAIGFGSTRPRDRRRTEAAMEANRRVEFVVLERHPPEETSP
jgi:outer membrane protein OmpA-like peptidoglycan-associated protein